MSFPYAWVNGHVTVAALLPSLRRDQVRASLWLFSNLPDLNKIVFTQAVPEAENKTAEILEQQASLVVVPDADPEDVKERFMAGSLN